MCARRWGTSPVPALTTRAASILWVRTEREASAGPLSSSVSDAAPIPSLSFLGGGCKHCGSVEHLRRNCPEFLKKGSRKIRVKMAEFDKSADADDALEGSGSESSDSDDEGEMDDAEDAAKDTALKVKSVKKTVVKF